MLSANNSVSWTKKHSLKSKWNLLFDKSPEWISFKPQLGFKVYPCYSCKNMFSSKLTFQDHINRRVVIIKYKCGDCTNTFTFYNRCSFLLHTRKHFSLAEGQVNLANVDIHLLPAELAGFTRHESIPFLFDEEEEFNETSTYINCQFYTPDDSEAGKQVITLKPFNLVFHYSDGPNHVLLVLKQVSYNVPLCEFVTQAPVPPEPQIKQEVDEDFPLPVIAKIESLKEREKCPECLKVVDRPLVAHFLGGNRPLDDALCCQVCKYVAPTSCSYAAHIRSHESKPPFVCPECGRQFRTFKVLDNHMEDVCFHSSKNVRFRCPALKCGKLFVLPNTYASHFANHFQNITKCSACTAAFYSESDFGAHAKQHAYCTPITHYNCLVCKSTDVLTHEQSTEHINWHLKDRERCVYIFTCKLCRSYFRSTTTYAVHKKRCCQKNEKVNFITSSCQFCGQKIHYRDKDTFKSCTVCKQINHVNTGKVAEEAKNSCMLCKEQLTQEELKVHDKVCKYNNPVVSINPISDTNDETNSSKESVDSSNDESPKKKRKRSVTPKKKEESDLQAETPVAFDGTYYCKLCDFKCTDRSEFHDHVVTHRNVATAYQCMDCGECFVVKPSLVKHLAHFHKITDPDLYFSENNCFDKGAIEELENNIRLGQSRPVKENQCSVCLEQFEDAASLDKHFRTHGMAFLLKKK